MSVPPILPPIRLRELRKTIEHGLEIEDIVPARNLASLTWDHALALVEAVEAARFQSSKEGYCVVCLYGVTNEAPLVHADDCPFARFTEEGT